MGSSYGGYLAALLTALRPVKWLALRVPALYKDSDWSVPKLRLRTEQGLVQFRQQPVRTDESKALRACSAFAGDVLIVESEHDCPDSASGHRQLSRGMHERALVDPSGDRWRRSRPVEGDVEDRLHGVAGQLVQGIRNRRTNERAGGWPVAAERARDRSCRRQEA